MPVTQLLRIGETSKTRSDLDSFLNSVRHRFTAATYDLINHNCNNFSDVICRFLTEDRAGVPVHIVDLPRIVFSTPGGAMLRPMFEGVSRQMTGAFNGSGSTGGTTLAGASFEQNLSQNISSTVGGVHSNNINMSSSASVSGSNSATAAASVSSYTFTPVSSESEKTSIQKLIDFVFTSNEASNIASISDKILAHKGGALLTDVEKEGMRDLVAVLKTNTQATILPTNGVLALHRAWSEEPTLQLSCLFLLRLVALHPQPVSIMEPILALLLDKLQTGSVSAFTSAATRTMGLSALVNYCSHPAGQAHALSVTHLERIVDIATSGVTAPATEPTVRLMSAALACNVTLACTKIPALSSEESIDSVIGSNGGSLVSSWHSSRLSDEDGLPPLGVQLLCSSLEAVDAEMDATVRFRKLVLASRILSSCGPTATALATELGFLDSIFGMLSGVVSVKHPLSNDEKLLCRYMYGQML